MARLLEVRYLSGVSLTIEVVARGTNVITETITMTERSVALMSYTGTIGVGTAAGDYELAFVVSGSRVATDDVTIGATDAVTYRPSIKTGYSLASTGFDSVLVESSITAGAGLTDDAGTQLTSINARQALAIILSGNGAVLAGAATTNVTIKPGGKPAGNNRVDATVTSDGNRTAVNLKVPT